MNLKQKSSVKEKTCSAKSVPWINKDKEEQKKSAQHFSSCLRKWPLVLRTLTTSNMMVFVAYKSPV